MTGWQARILFLLVVVPMNGIILDSSALPVAAAPVQAPCTSKPCPPSTAPGHRSPTPSISTTTPSPGANAVLTLPYQGSPDGCKTTALSANDDGSTALIPLGFTINFAGTQFGSAYVNNNGNITFQDVLPTYTPFGLVGTATPIIAPFFADVDTRGSGSGLATYGQTTFRGHPAFCIN